MLTSIRYNFSANRIRDFVADRAAHPKTAISFVPDGSSPDTPSVTKISMRRGAVPKKFCQRTNSPKRVRHFRRLSLGRTTKKVFPFSANKRLHFCPPTFIHKTLLQSARCPKLTISQGPRFVCFPGLCLSTHDK